MLTTVYIIATLVLFSLNLLSNVFALSVRQKEGFPAAEFIAMILAIIFIIFGITILVS